MEHTLPKLTLIKKGIKICRVYNLKEDIENIKSANDILDKY